MKKVLFLTLLVLALPLSLLAADRVVVLEIFTGTWCYYCPGAAMGAEDLVGAYQGDILVVEYHVGSSDPFVNTGSSTRVNFYGESVVRGVPTAIFDGVDTLIGGFHDQSLYSYYNPMYNARRAVEPPLEITLEKTDNAFMGQGTLTATIKNTSAATVSGTVHFTVTESNISYAWQGLTKVHFVERDMLPDASGESITLAPDETKVIERDFVVDDSWPYYTEDEGNLEFGCFVQDNTSSDYLKEIYQAAVVPLVNPLTEDVEEGKELALAPFSLSVPTIVNGQGTVELSLDKPANVDIRLYDANGRQIKVLHSGTLGAGVTRLDIPTGNLSSGVYFVKALAGSQTKAERFVVLD